MNFAGGLIPRWILAKLLSVLSQVGGDEIDDSRSSEACLTTAPGVVAVGSSPAREET